MNVSYYIYVTISLAASLYLFVYLWIAKNISDVVRTALSPFYYGKKEPRCHSKMKFSLSDLFYLYDGVRDRNV